MKTKRITFVAFLLVAIMLLGIGFAAVIDDLTIGGSMTTNTSGTQVAFKEKIYFSAATVESTEAAAKGDEANITQNANAGDNADVVDLLVKSLSVRGNSTSFMLTIKNESDQYAATIKLGTPVKEGDSSYYDVKYYDENGDELVAGEEFRCESEDVVKVKVVVTLLASPDVTINGTFSVELNATSAAKRI